MRLMGLEAIYRAPRTSAPHPEHRVYPYLLRGLAIERPNHVWCADITYIPVSRGFLYLVAIMDWASRYMLAWRLSNTLDAGFCTDALDEALAAHGAPEIFNTDQGSQFTGMAFTARLQAAGAHPRELQPGHRVLRARGRATSPAHHDAPSRAYARANLDDRPPSGCHSADSRQPAGGEAAGPRASGSPPVVPAGAARARMLSTTSALQAPQSSASAQAASTASSPSS